MTTAALIFPHQLFAPHPAIDAGCDAVWLVQEPLFFGDPHYPAKFHKQKLAYHRKTMVLYANALRADGHKVTLWETTGSADMLDKVLTELARAGVTLVRCCEVVDFILEKRLAKAAHRAGIELEVLQTPAFINSEELNRSYRDGRKGWFMADFYMWQRKRLGILLEDDGKPTGGKWSFDKENRKKVPKAKLRTLPFVPSRSPDDKDAEIAVSIEAQWSDNPGNLSQRYYPETHADAATWLRAFLEERFAEFGPYEDAIVEGESWLWHSVLTPMLNIGLLTPRQVVNETLDWAKANAVPLNSLEGFLRQIIGWREFIRATYDDLGVTMRTTNHWQHTRPLPDCFYDASTGLPPLDDVIGRLNDTAYNHHIERLMVLGGYMFICEIDPDDIYRWFMEMFIDAYDWVMVPNVYAMSQNADGGLITTKPYFSGSAYIRKMSNFEPGDWCDIWDGLYWRFIWKHRSKLRSNPRWAMMCAQVEKMPDAKREAHLAIAEHWLAANVPPR